MATVATVNRLKDLWGAERAEVDTALRRAGYSKIMFLDSIESSIPRKMRSSRPFVTSLAVIRM
jgi:hypothetical protein